MVSIKQFAGMNLHYKRYSFEYFLQSLKRLEINNCELWMGAPHFYNYYNAKNNKCLDEIKRLCSNYDIKIICVTPEQCVYAPNIASADKELREYSIQYYINYIEQTAQLEVPRMLTSAGWGNYDDDFGLCWNRAIDSFGKLLTIAERECVEIAFEILLPYETNIVNSLGSLKEFIGAFNSPNLKCAIDTVPVTYEGRKLSDYFEAFNDLISHIHLIDGTPDGHLVWGDGNQPLAEHLLALGKYSYGGYITFEIAHPKYYQDPEGALRRSLDVIQQKQLVKMC